MSTEKNNRTGRVIREYQIHCAGKCGIYTSDSNRKALEKRVARRIGYEKPWEKIDGAWHCGGCAGWVTVRVRKGSKEWDAIQKIRDSKKG